MPMSFEINIALQNKTFELYESCIFYFTKLLHKCWVYSRILENLYSRDSFFEFCNWFWIEMQRYSNSVVILLLKPPAASIEDGRNRESFSNLGYINTNSGWDSFLHLSLGLNSLPGSCVLIPWFFWVPIFCTIPFSAHSNFCNDNFHILRSQCAKAQKYNRAK